VFFFVAKFAASLIFPEVGQIKGVLKESRRLRERIAAELLMVTKRHVLETPDQIRFKVKQRLMPGVNPIQAYPEWYIERAKRSVGGVNIVAKNKECLSQIFE
jgi:hypothetical protein